MELRAHCSLMDGTVPLVSLRVIDSEHDTF